MKMSFPLIFLWLGLLVGCTQQVSVMPTARLIMTDIPTVTQQPSTTATPAPTSTVTDTPTPSEKQLPFVDPYSSSTPGPTPTTEQVTMLPGECLASPLLSGDAVDVREVGSTLCLLWEDKYTNETGFRVELQFGYNGEMFVYDVPANRPGMPYPPILSAPLGQSFEYCVVHKDYQVDIYALLPDQEPVLVTGMAANLECNVFDMPSATPRPPAPEYSLTPEAIRGYLAANLGISSFGGKVFCAYETLSASQDAAKPALYVWAYCQEYYGEKTLQKGTGMSLPVALYLQSFQDVYGIASYKVPGDGTKFEQDIKALFPKPTWDRIFGVDPVTYNRHAQSLGYETEAAAMVYYGVIRSPSAHPTYTPNW